MNRIKSVQSAAVGDSKSNDGLVVDISADRAECLCTLVRDGARKSIPCENVNEP